MRLAMLAAVACASVPAGADPIEATGFFGVDYFGNHIGLGSSPDPEQIPMTSPMVGARLTYVALPHVGPLALAGELELALTPAWTGYGFDARRMSYFSPVVGWHGDVLVRWTRLGPVAPHLVLGGGGESVRSQSPYMAKETDPVALWGLGATFSLPDLAGRWQVRIDARQGIMPARGGGVTSTFQLQVGFGIAFGVARRHVTAQRVEVATAAADKDSDGDGIPDRLDKCPSQPETVNGVADDDGCPEPDPDGDGIVGDRDRCPNAPEDFDHFQDEDGCPDPDNDGDGIPDVKDACPNDRETFNLFEDEDGCPDQVPAAITSALAVASGAKFDRERARITPATERALEAVLGVLRERPTLHVTVIAHPGRAADAALAKKRAEAVKWYLVDAGVAQDQLITSVGALVKTGPVIELQLAASAPKQ